MPDNDNPLFQRFHPESNSPAAPASAAPATVENNPLTKYFHPPTPASDGGATDAAVVPSAPSTDDNPLLARFHPQTAAAPDIDPAAYTDQPWYSKAWEHLWDPLVKVNPSYFEGQPVALGVLDVLSSLSAPANLAISVATLGAGLGEEAAGGGIGMLLKSLGMGARDAALAGKTARGLAAAGFTWQTVGATVESSGRALDAYQHGDYDAAERYATHAAAGLVGTALLAKELHSTAKSFSVKDDPGIFEAIRREHQAETQKGLTKTNEQFLQLKNEFETLTEGADPDKLRRAMLFRMEFPGDPRDGIIEDGEIAEHPLANNVQVQYVRNDPSSDVELVFAHHPDANNAPAPEVSATGFLKEPADRHRYLSNLVTNTDAGGKTRIVEKPRAVLSTNVNSSGLELYRLGPSTWGVGKPSDVQEGYSDIYGKVQLRPDGTVENLGVAQKYQKKGLAQAMLQAAKLESGKTIKAPSEQLSEEGRRAIERFNKPAYTVPARYADEAVKAGIDPSKIVGHVVLTRDADGRIYSSDTAVAPEYRRQGVASAMYDRAQNATGAKMKPGPLQTGLGKKLVDSYFNAARPRVNHEMSWENEGGAPAQPRDIEWVNKLAQASEVLTPEDKEAYQMAVNLSAPQRAFVRKLLAYGRETYAAMEANGMAPRFLENHISHVWRKPAADQPDITRTLVEGNKVGQFDTRISAAMKRHYNTFYNGLESGLRIAEPDPMKVLAQARAEALKAMQNRLTLKQLRTTYTQDGRPMAELRGVARIIGNGDAPVFVDPDSVAYNRISKEELKRIPHASLQAGLNTGVIEEHFVEAPPQGGKMQADLDRWENEGGAVAGHFDNSYFTYSTKGYVNIDHPAFKDWHWIENVEGHPLQLKSDLVLHPAHAQQIVQGLGLDTSAIRKSAIGRAVLGISSAVKKSVFFTNLFHFDQEGLRTLYTGDNPFRMPPVNMDDPEIYQGVAHDLVFHNHYEFYSDPDDMNEGLSSGKGMLDKVPVLGPMNTYLHDSLWRYVNSQKAQAFKTLLERNRNAHPDWDMHKLYYESAHETNDRFGLQNWRALGLTKTQLDIYRLALLAPDWFTSEVRSIARVFNPETGTLARRDLVRFTAATILALRVANKLYTGDYHWEQPFGLVIPRGKDDKRDPLVLSVRSLPTDLFHFISDPRAAVMNRLNPLTVNPMFQVLTQRDKSGRRVFAPDVVLNTVQGLAPIWAQNLMQRTDLSLNAKERALKTGIQLAGGMEYTARTVAERDAMSFAYADLGDKDPDKVQRNLVEMRLVDGLRAGKIKPPLVHQLMPQKTAETLIKESKMDPLQGYFQRLTLNQKLQVWMKMDREEQAQVRKNMMTSRRNWLLSHPSSKDRDGQPEWLRLQEAFPDLRR